MSHKKPAERRQRHGEVPPLAVIRTGMRPAVVPEGERGWLAATRASWRTFWREGIARLTEPVDEVAIRRLFALYDARARLWALFLKRPHTRGSTGQEVLNPMGAFALQLEG